eukprot:333135_1
MDPGCDTIDDKLLHNATSGDRIVDSTGSDANAEKIRGVDELMDKVALPIAKAAKPNIPTANFSVVIALLFPFLSTLVDDVNCPNTVDPNRQHAMKHENTVPYGVLIEAAESVANFEKYELTALLTAGGQLRTKMYIAASNNDWIAPTK